MKGSMAQWPSVFFFVLIPTAYAATLNNDPITQVVQALQTMLSQSQTDGAAEDQLYDAYKCYVDDNTEAQTTLVDQLTTSIGLLESDIQALQGQTGDLSSQVGQLAADIAANVQARTDADTLRNQEAADFATEEADLTAAISQMGQAIDVLSAIGADQTAAAAAADHNKFMAGYGSPASTQLLKIHAKVRQALLAADIFLTPAQRKKMDVFLQTSKKAPFTGTYTSQAGEIVGILKSMKDTFESNLEAARTAENASIAAHTTYMSTKLAEHGTMSTAYDQKQGQMGSNDGDLATKRQQLTDAITQKTNAETFLSNLATMAEEKTKEYEHRKLLRTNEEAAISKAIAILSNDQAFDAFGKVSSTSATSLLQLRVVHRHLARSNGTRTAVAAASQALQRCSSKSKRVRRVLMMLKLGNPFDQVLAQIEKMKTVIDEEEALDAKQLAWCNAERTRLGNNLASKNQLITDTNSAISSLEAQIDDPATGLKKQIADLEQQLETNSQSQKDETETRRDAAQTYTQSVRDATHAHSILEKAVTVLQNYYAEMEASVAAQLGAFVQKHKKQSPPATWTGSYEGQSPQGQTVIGMLESIMSDIKDEENALHEAESLAQKDFEDSMATLKDSEATLQTSLVNTKKTLADTELELANERETLDVTTREKTSIERYLEDISPGCDFITANYAMRNTNRAAEKTALEQAVTALQATPAYVAAVNDAEIAALGGCKPLCLGANRTHVQCEACLAKVSVPGYCAGHPTTTGC